MIRQIQTSAVAVVVLAAFALQGMAFVQCSGSGEVYLSGWSDAGCTASSNNCCSENADPGCCCESGASDLEGGLACCFLVGVVPDSFALKTSSVSTPPLTLAEFELNEFLVAFDEGEDSDIAPSADDPDPPGVSLRIVYASFLI